MARLSWQEEQDAIAEAIKGFPATFHLPNCKDWNTGEARECRLSQGYSFFSDGVMLLYTEVLMDGKWLSYAKGTVEELRRAIRL